MAVSLLINARSSIPINIHCAAEGVNLLVPVMVLRIVHLIMSNSLVYHHSDTLHVFCYLRQSPETCRAVYLSVT